jgi:hypothetical protein
MWGAIISALAPIVVGAIFGGDKPKKGKGKSLVEPTEPPPPRKRPDKFESGIEAGAGGQARPVGTTPSLTSSEVTGRAGVQDEYDYWRNLMRDATFAGKIN